MTTTHTSTPERARREAELWTRQPELPLEEVIATVDAQMKAEAIEAEERAAQAKEMSDAFAGLCVCQVCGESRGLGARDGLCGSCRSVVARVRAERLEGERVDGRSRRELAVAFLDRQAAR